MFSTANDKSYSCFVITKKTKWLRKIHTALKMDLIHFNSNLQIDYKRKI